MFVDKNTEKIGGVDGILSFTLEVGDSDILKKRTVNSKLVLLSGSVETGSIEISSKGDCIKCQKN